MSEEKDKYQCRGAATCGYIYDPDRGDKRGEIPKGIPFEDHPEDWQRPGCGVSKDRFCSIAGTRPSGENSTQ